MRKFINILLIELNFFLHEWIDITFEMPWRCCAPEPPTCSPVIIEYLGKDAGMSVEEVFVEDGIVISQRFSKSR